MHVRTILIDGPIKPSGFFPNKLDTLPDNRALNSTTVDIKNKTLI